MLLGGCGDDEGGGNNANGNNNNVAGVCGDGRVDPGEQCDDGTENSDSMPDACRSNCRFATCGDLVVDTGEVCDDGDDGTNRADSCPNDCQTPVCGDRHLHLGAEVCDDGNTADGDDCRGDCLQDMTLCGNGIVDSGEECDSASANSDTEPNRCRTNCQLPWCSDGVLDLGEACDDGSSNSDTEPDACRTDCTAAGCGDGVMDSGEQCDGTDLGSATCASLVSSTGTLGCNSGCTFDVGECDFIDWVALSGGSFEMGSTSWSFTQPVHNVTVSGFELTRAEVTVRQYGYCVTAGSCTPPNTGDLCNWRASGYEEHPVNCLDWSQAREFCAWVGGRLPSESEWEYAARSGGQAIDYPWGNSTATCDYAVMNDGGNGCGTDRTFAVCSKTAGNTTQGLCDMSGNLWEWVEDDLHNDYTGAPTDGSAWVDNPRGAERVVRGGSYAFGADALRTAIRDYGSPSIQYSDVGFRCAR
jgi:hypothetical protein